MIGNKPDGININEECGSTHIENVARTVRELGLDCGVAFDGDADRCICVDENGCVVDGDVIMAVCALDLLERGRLSNKTVVGTIMANLGFSKFCEENTTAYRLSCTTATLYLTMGLMKFFCTGSTSPSFAPSH